MKIIIAADKGGFALKEHIAAFLKNSGHEVTDVGMKREDEPVWWYEGCKAAVSGIQSGEFERGILICGSGAGMALLANKHKGIFAVPCESQYTAQLARQFIGANVLTMGGYVVGPGQGIKIAETFINTEFAQGENEERVRYLKDQYDELCAMDEECF